MERKLKLSKNAYLWEAGDNAHNIAILESGRLGVRVDDRIVGIISPKMVLGEIAILTLDGKQPKRTATVVALEDDTNITEYPAELVKKTFDSANYQVTNLILTTLVAQVCRNGLLLMSTHKARPVVATPIKSLIQGIINSKDQMKAIDHWDEFMLTFKFMNDLRDFSETLRQQHVIMTSDKAEMIEKASETIKEMFKNDDDLSPMLEGFMKAEQDKDTWLERSEG